MRSACEQREPASIVFWCGVVKSRIECDIADLHDYRRFQQGVIDADERGLL